MTSSTPFPTGPISSIRGTTVVVRGDDIDTDRIIPARFLKCVTFDALGPAAFADDRAELTASPAGPHPFDRPEHQGAAILLVNRNFGCGSSREHAPQALMRWGIRAVVGESFAEIFYGNCLALGIPCLAAEHDTMLAIQAAAQADPAAVFEVDVANACLSLRRAELGLGFGSGSAPDAVHRPVGCHWAAARQRRSSRGRRCAPAVSERLRGRHSLNCLSRREDGSWPMRFLSHAQPALAGWFLALPLAAAAAQPIAVEPYTPAAPPWQQCRGCDLRGADLRGLLLNGMDLREADLRGADLRGSNLEGADLSGADLRGARLQQSWLTNADLSDADLRQANLQEAVLIQALTPGAQIQGAVLVGADFTGSDLFIGGEEPGPAPLPPVGPQKPRR